MAMRILPRTELEQELHMNGLKPTDTAAHGFRVWETKDGRAAFVPETAGGIPDHVLEAILRELGRLYR